MHIPYVGERMYALGMGVRGPKPKSRISTEWRPELAYVVGSIASDGCLSSDGRHIDLTSKGIDQLDTFKHILGIEHIKIGKKTSGYTEAVLFHVQFGSVVFYEWLVSIGLTPKKSRTIGELAIPDEYFTDFLRGLFDGDGSTYSYWDPRWKSSFMYYLEFTSASEAHILWLRSRIVRLWHVFGSVAHTGNHRAFILRYAKREGRLLLDRMYADPHAVKLDRKFAKVQKMFIIDDTHSTLSCKMPR
jgi:hypothetical protein